MKVIGLIGGLSWESSAEYYRIINELVRDQLGGSHSAKILMYSVDFHEIEQLQQAGRWDEAAQAMIDAAKRLERGGAEMVLICANTMHKSAPAVQNVVKIPLIHIASATADRIKAAGLQRIGLLGTKYTMEHDFYKGILTDQYSLEVLIPDEADRQIVHQVIYDELCLGRIVESSRREYARIMDALVARGAQAIILGCTEIMLLVKPEDASVPLFDTTRIHAEKAVELAMIPSPTVYELLAAKRAEILQAAARYGASNVRLFGSVARGEATPESDVDFLVDFEDGRTLLDQAGLTIELQEILGHEVDVASEDGLKPRAKESVLHDARLL